MLQHHYLLQRSKSRGNALTIRRSLHTDSLLLLLHYCIHLLLLENVCKVSDSGRSLVEDRGQLLLAYSTRAKRSRDHYTSSPSSKLPAGIFPATSAEIKLPDTIWSRPFGVICAPVDLDDHLRFVQLLQTLVSIANYSLAGQGCQWRYKYVKTTYELFETNSI